MAAVVMAAKRCRLLRIKMADVDGANIRLRAREDETEGRRLG